MYIYIDNRKSHSPNGSFDFTGPKKVLIHGPNRPRNEKNRPEKIMHGSDKFIGALIVNITSLSLSFKKNIYEVLIINYPYVDAYYVSRILYHCSDVFYIFYVCWKNKDLFIYFKYSRYCKLESGSYVYLNTCNQTNDLNLLLFSLN